MHSRGMLVTATQAAGAPDASLLSREGPNNRLARGEEALPRTVGMRKWGQTYAPCRSTTCPGTERRGRKAWRRGGDAWTDRVTPLRPHAGGGRLRLRGCWAGGRQWFSGGEAQLPGEGHKVAQCLQGVQAKWRPDTLALSVKQGRAMPGRVRKRAIRGRGRRARRPLVEAKQGRAMRGGIKGARCPQGLGKPGRQGSKRGRVNLGLVKQGRVTGVSSSSRAIRLRAGVKGRGQSGGRPGLGGRQEEGGERTMMLCV